MDDTTTVDLAAVVVVDGDKAHSVVANDAATATTEQPPPPLKDAEERRGSQRRVIAPLLGGLASAVHLLSGDNARHGTSGTRARAVWRPHSRHEVATKRGRAPPHAAQRTSSSR